MNATQEQRALRYQRLSRVPKRLLAEHYTRISGYVGGLHHPSAWSKDDLIASILNIEYPETTNG